MKRVGCVGMEKVLFNIHYNLSNVLSAGRPLL